MYETGIGQSRIDFESLRVMIKSVFMLNSNINNTIIDGSCLTMGDDLGSVIVIDSPFTSCIQPEIFGFTIQGGIGTKIVKEMYDDDCPSGQDTCTYERIAGGGIIVNDSWSRNVIPSIHYNKIIDNGSADCISERSECNEFGGGLALASGTDIDFPSRNVSNKLIGNNIDRDCNDLAQNISNNVYKN